MAEKAFTPIISNAKIRASQIAKATFRVIYCAPGITELEIHSLVKIQDKLPQNSIQLLLDTSADSFRSGYWGDILPSRLSHSGLYLGNSWIANGLRLGILIVDNLSWVFVPTPQIIENDDSHKEANCLELDPNTTDLLVSSLSPRKDIPIRSRQPITAPQLEHIEKEIVQKSIPFPSQKRRVELIRPHLKIIQFEIRGNKLTQNKIRLPREVIDVIGSSDPTINDRINADWKVFSDTAEIELGVHQKILERKLEEIKDRYCIRFGHYGYGLAQTEKGNFLEAWEKMEKHELAEFKSKIKEKIEGLINNSKDLLRTLIRERISKGTLLIPKPRLLFETPVEEQMTIYINSIIHKVPWPEPEKVINQIVIKYREYDISDQMLADPEFLIPFETSFGKLEDIIKRLESAPEEHNYTPLYVSLN